MAWPDGKRLVADTCPHFPAGAPDGHIADCDAEMMVIGEAPGRNENDKGIPFVGEAGRLWERELLRPNELDRHHCYVTNVLPWQPPGNKFEVAYSVPGLVQRHLEALRAKVAAFRGRIVVPMGNHALQAATGKSGIFKWRGSVLGDGPWTIPTIHPAAALRSPLLIKTMRYDWARIAGVVRDGWTLPQYELITTTHNDRRLQELYDAKVLSFDIETVRGTGRILCISFCHDRSRSYSIDCRFGIPALVRDLLTSGIPKIATNGSFDCYVLEANKIVVRNFTWDTMLMFHALDNNAGPTTAATEADGKSILKPYSLAYGASIFTPFPYWKDSGKDAGDGEDERAATRDWASFMRYNAMDSLGSFWLASALRAALAAAGRLDFYKEQYAKLLDPIRHLAQRGVRFDLAAARRRTEALEGVRTSLRNELEHVAGRPLHGTKQFKKQPKQLSGRKDGLVVSQRNDGTWVGEKASLSTPVLHDYLYGTLGLKKQTKDGKVTADEIAIRNLLLYVAEGGDSRRRWRGDRAKTTDLLNTILKFRETEKTAQFLAARNVDEDGRIRASYSMTTQTGRLRSAGNPAGTGMNLQNVQRDVRHFFVPDLPAELGVTENVYFLEIDLKQAEDLVVKAMSAAVTGDNRPLKLINTVWSGSGDIHKRLAALVFGVPGEAVTYGQRYCAKRCRHAKNNGMQPKRMQETLLKDGFVMPLAEVAAISAAIDAAEPWVEEFHKAVRLAIMQSGGVSTSWGWHLDFNGERLSDASVYRRGYAYIQQSEIGVLMKQWGLLTYWNEILPRFRARLNMLVHDNMVLSVPESEIYAIMAVLHRSLTQPRAYGVRRLDGTADATETIAIPADMKISRALSCTCDDCKGKQPVLEFGRMPSRDEFDQTFNTWEGRI